jgi:hypothetical protein
VMAPRISPRSYQPLGGRLTITGGNSTWKGPSPRPPSPKEAYPFAGRCSPRPRIRS